MAGPVRTRGRALLLAAALGAGVLAAAPADASLPSVCYTVPALSDTRALVTYDANARNAAVRAVTAAGGRIVGGIPRLHTVEAAFGSRALRDAALPALRTAPGVRGADPEHVQRALRQPKDPFLRYQWGLFKVGATKGWDRETGTHNPPVVAVLDTGVDFQHPDLVGHVTRGKNIVANNDDPQDDHSHGTHVAGIVAAATNNRRGVAGMSWGAQVLAVKVLDASGEGSDCDIALGLLSAADAGAKVLNLSLGAEDSPCGLVMQSAVDYALDKGALPVVSSGNGAKHGNKPSSPANCEGVLAVGATDVNDKIANFSTHQSYVGVSAPGVNILSTYYDPKKNKRSYVSFSGTSMAAPMVSGLAALLLSKHKDWTPEQVMARIVKTADDKGLRGKDPYYGAGRINVARALAG
jgi:thermitase